jgi:hypothetical protein
MFDLLFGPRNPSLEWPPYKGQPTHFGDYESFAGRFVSGGETIPLATWTEQEIIEHFGPPREIDRDETEIVLFYDRDKYEWNFELSLDSRLKCLLVFSS